MAKNLNLNRDTKKQLEYKSKLEEESLQIYGSVRCWACRKPYKGLIASHIKPYKLCVIENDEYSKFNINNGLLLAKNIDDYFDKLEITFDDNGYIICSDNVAEEIREEFKNYKLDENVYNAERRHYMALHRSLFYYKHYIASEPISYQKQFEKIEIPYFDCGIKFYQSQFIVQVDGRWHKCLTTKIKEEFIRRTKFKFQCYISNADFVNLILKNEQYIVPEKIKPYLNFKTYSIDFSQPDVKITDIDFRLCRTDFDPCSGFPEMFLKLLRDVLNENIALIKNFQRILGLALSGEGFHDGVYLYGDIPAINFMMDILQSVLGTYFFEYDNAKVLYKTVKVDSIPNTRLLYFRECNGAIQHRQVSKLAENELFPKSVLNIDKFVAFISSSQIPKDHTQELIFKFHPTNQLGDISQYISEFGKILNWILIGYEEYKRFGFEQVNENFVGCSPESMLVEEWLTKCCVVNIQDHTLSERASNLYESFYRYITDNELPELSYRMFFLILSKKFNKTRYAEGITYFGLSLKK